MSIADVVMTDTARHEALKILAEIEHAEGLLEMSQLAGVAEGFIRGLACGLAITPHDLEALERVFDGAVNRRMGALRRGE
ncbi:hypothetical protein IFR09_03195 [Pseudomonas syringae]|nr:hypothetical protein [Pseudomonas syringae]MBD8573906.1 hypothetical protein [Pseudomonas syringae]MBD8791309.1 hypothetical protein [Pseudomonas syringae]MBD8801557.1 hypothetical protein [Pseudomonas syringae]MBD8810166.1 hypothetical protein [Pseudomonas syringae]